VTWLRSETGRRELGLEGGRGGGREGGRGAMEVGGEEGKGGR